MATIFALANQKGGVGKTTTGVNLAASLAAINRRVLLIDLDPQGNATMGSGVDKHQLGVTSGDVLLGKAQMDDGVLSVDRAAYALLPANGELTVAEVELMTASGREFKLRQALEPLASRYDYVLVDCPPALNTLTVNALVAAHGVIIPMQCEYYALEGLSALVGTIDRIRQTANPHLRIAGLLRTMFDPRNNLANDVSAQLISHFGDRVFETMIPRNVRLAEAPSHGLPVLLYDKASRGALAYLSLAGELLRKERRGTMFSPVGPVQRQAT
jgi:chromosome partitioning protein